MRRHLAHRSTLALSLVLGLAAGCGPSGGGGGGGGVTAVDACGQPTSGPTTVSATLSADTTWDAAHSPYVIADGDVVKVGAGATLTVGKCTRVVLGSGAGLDVAGHLVTQGASGSEVSFEPSGTGYWGTVVADQPSATLDLAFTRFVHGGNTSGGDPGVVVVTGDRGAVPKATLHVSYVTITDAAGSGVNLTQGAAFAPGSTNLTISGTGASPAMDGSSPMPSYPVRIFAESAGSLPLGAYTGNAIDGILVSGLDPVAQSETLDDPGVPWILGDAYTPGGLDVQPTDTATGDVTVTIAAGVTVKLSAGAEMSVHAGASGAGAHLVVAGTAAHHVTLTGDTADRWNNLSVMAPATLSLSYTDIDAGGLTGGSGGGGETILADGSSGSQPDEILEVHHVTISDSGTVGVLLQDGAAFASGSDDLNVTGSGADVSPDTGNPIAVPLALEAASLYSLPLGSHFDGSQPGIWVNGGTITRDTELPDDGAPYLVYGTITVGSTSGAPATLTVDPGTTLRFASGESLTVNVHGLGQGALKAVGTAGQPIAFTSWSDTPAAGDWVGIIFQGDSVTPALPSRLANLRISYAGGPDTFANYACEPNGDDENGALGFFDYIPSKGDFTGLLLSDSAGNGIVEGWSGPFVDLKSANTFSGIAECEAVAPRSVSGCPSAPACL